jgi:hypothetical protein
MSRIAFSAFVLLLGCSSRQPLEVPHARPPPLCVATSSTGVVNYGLPRPCGDERWRGGSARARAAN